MNGDWQLGLRGWLGTLALLNAGLAQSKGRSGFPWFLISLLVGPIATFVLVAFVKPELTLRLAAAQLAAATDASRASADRGG